ncbi:MAG: peptide ABC transporter substrate-binding protein [Eubacteriales bacterium]|nr:peptide ABC transporter substrate-binding protein [Eubacteriales bacterium]
MKKILALLLVLALALSIVACTGTDDPVVTDPQGTEAPTDAPGTDEPTEPGEEPTEPVEPGTSLIAVSLSSEPDTLDPALNSAVDGATLIVHLFSGLAKWSVDAEGNYVIVPDAAEELVDGVLNDDGTVTYTYTLRDGMIWSDGEPVTAENFEFAWKRASSVELGADYGYMFEVIDGFGEEINVTATDEKTLEVTLANAVPYWNELLAFPTYFPVREDVVADETWATDPSTYVSNGPYTMSGWDHNSLITLQKNPDYIDADEVTMDTIEFYLSDDSNNMLANFKSGAWQLIDDVPTNEISSLKEEYPDEFFIQGQIGTYYVCWNVNANILPAGSDLTGVEAEMAQAEIRNAISLLFDRNYIVEEIAQGGQIPASSFVSMGLSDADGSEFYLNAGSSDDYHGYYNTDPSEEVMDANYNAAIEVLKKYYTFDEATQQFTDVPTLDYLYNTSEGHKAIGEYLQSALAGVGINMTMENQEWATFLNTRKEGNYTVARNGWIADYNDPITLLDLWTSASGNNDVQFGKDAHADVAAYDIDLTEYGLDVVVEGGTWAETYDVIIAAVKASTDDAQRYGLMHAAEDLLMSTGAVTPIYYYTDLYMLSDSVSGFFSIPLGYKYFMYTTVE